MVAGTIGKTALHVKAFGVPRLLPPRLTAIGEGGYETSCEVRKVSEAFH